MPIGKAYMLSGYKVKDANVARANGSRLLRNASVRNRYRELVEALAETMVVTRESLASELDDAAAQAEELGQSSARVSALAAKAKLFGLEAPTRNLNVNLSGTFNQLTDDELRFEVASMINEARSVKGVPPIALPAKREDGKE
ncbi:terminase small subunit [Mesorhizobium sp. M0050]|uniref:hypothetical protein n=1 Tax=Mesorhizobium sp. M0050 TaxID=2956861 RepID=UPI00333C6064